MSWPLRRNRFPGVCRLKRGATSSTRAKSNQQQALAVRAARAFGAAHIQPKLVRERACDRCEAADVVCHDRIVLLWRQRADAGVLVTLTASIQRYRPTDGDVSIPVRPHPPARADNALLGARIIVHDLQRSPIHAPRFPSAMGQQQKSVPKQRPRRTRYSQAGALRNSRSTSEGDRANIARPSAPAADCAAPLCNAAVAFWEAKSEAPGQCGAVLHEVSQSAGWICPAVQLRCTGPPTVREPEASTTRRAHN